MSEEQKKAWQAQAHACPRDKEGAHQFMVINWMIQAKSRHAQTIMCQKCFHTVEITEVWQFRELHPHNPDKL